MKKNNQILLSIIGVAILIVATVGVTFAFFNYTRTGSENTLSVGRIYFSFISSICIIITIFCS